MFLEFYQLKEQPFGVAPDPRYLYLGASHREALASLSYGVKESRGLLALVAPPGMGKTTLLFRFLEHLRRSARTAFLFQTQCDSKGLLHYLLRDLGINTQGQDFVTMHDRLNEILLQEARAGRRFVVVIDEAQNLDDSVLETARLLSNFETPHEKLLQIVFAGQPQLALKLARPELVQLRQRISILGRLRPFSPTEVTHYINHRLGVAGRCDESLFTPPAIESIAFRTGGIPRNINNICFNALSLGCALGRKQIDVDLIDEVTADFELGSLTDCRQSEVHSLPQARTNDLTDTRVQFPALGLSEQSQAAGDQSDVQGSANDWCKDEKSSLVLEILDDAEQRGAEILAEVVSSDPLVGGPVLVPLEDRADNSRNPDELSEYSLDQTPVVNAASSLSPTDQCAGELQPGLANVPPSPSLSNQISCPPISYPAQKKSKTNRLLFVAAIFVLAALAAIFYRQNIQALAAHKNQAVVAESRAPEQARFVAGLTPVTVQPNDDLRQICLRYLGKFDGHLVEEIRALNPEVANPDHITVGQRILLPGVTIDSNRIVTSARPEL